MSKNPFDDYIEFIKSKHGEESWITVYKSTPIKQVSESVGLYSAFVTSDKTQVALDNTSWDLTYGAGRPGFIINYQNGEKKVNYYSNEEEGFLRLVLNREFHDRMSDYVDILEEFRLFHNLYYLENEKNISLLMR
jgi:hypothetical protein